MAKQRLAKALAKRLGIPVAVAAFMIWAAWELFMR